MGTETENALPGTGAASPSPDVIQRFESLDYLPPKDGGGIVARMEVADLSRHIPNWTVGNQKWRGTCVAFAATSCAELARVAAGHDHAPLSPEFLYWSMRQNPSFTMSADTVPDYDLGATKLTQAANVLSQQGLCTASLLPYQTMQMESDHPSDAAKADAGKYKFTIEKSLDYVNGDKAGYAITAYDELLAGRAVAVATAMFRLFNPGYDNFTAASVASTGRILTPLMEPELFLGPFENGQFTQDKLDFFSSHVFCLTGFIKSDDPSTNGWFTFRNSWGTGFGKHVHWVGEDQPRPPAQGYGVIPFNYIDKYAHELLSVSASA
ncbi:C1 family peptidase [Pseudoprimorskyibacter insulae]|uniref:Peptidase C1A papain C-terminal domain-containing protein n=1 Tax=Pseudoprimorskyibacter insulae TaxID=1695997 RepID=A0A2R8B0W0_9RHOB|nr:C1 family peptidase [Pseudoprimorskyibacter insulae]SPF81857.1 hypothetical protein PRI8871_03683 [Pseudoprimorskyibacter insulae]